MVEEARLCPVGCAALDQRVVSQQPADPARAAGKDRPAHAAPAKRRHRRTAARPWQDDQRDQSIGKSATGAGLTIAARSPVTPGCVLGNTAAVRVAYKAASPNTAIPDSERRWWNWLGEWSASSPIIVLCANGKRAWPKALFPLAPRARKPSWRWPASWQSICGGCGQAGAGMRSWGSKFE